MHHVACCHVLHGSVCICVVTSLVRVVRHFRSCLILLACSEAESWMTRYQVNHTEFAHYMLRYIITEVFKQIGLQCDMCPLLSLWRLLSLCALPNGIGLQLQRNYMYKHTCAQCRIISIVDWQEWTQWSSDNQISLATNRMPCLHNRSRTFFLRIFRHPEQVMTFLPGIYNEVVIMGYQVSQESLTTS